MTDFGNNVREDGSVKIPTISSDPQDETPPPPIMEFMDAASRYPVMKIAWERVPGRWPAAKDWSPPPLKERL